MNCHDFGCPPLREGGKACHCGACHRTFASLALFDAHQETDYKGGSGVSCKSPEALGLVQAPNGTWWTPDTLTALTGKLEKMALARQAA